MSVKDFTVKVSGTVAYTDQSHGSFEAVGKWTGHLGKIIAQHSNTESLKHFRQLYADKSIGVMQLLDLLAPPATPGHISLSPQAPSLDKIVSSFTMEISGIVSFNDSTTSGFVVQWVDGATSFFPTETTSTWSTLATTLTGSPSPVDFLISVFNAVADSTTII